MCKCSRQQKTRYQEGRDRAGCDIGIAVGDVVQHAEVEQRVSEAEHAARNDGRPIACFAVAGKGEPEEGNGEKPNCHEVGEEAGFGAALATVL